MGEVGVSTERMTLWELPLFQAWGARFLAARCASSDCAGLSGGLARGLYIRSRGFQVLARCGNVPGQLGQAVYVLRDRTAGDFPTL